MKVPDLTTALRLVKRYGVTTRPGQYPQPGRTWNWNVQLQSCTFRTSNGKDILANLWAPCTMTTENLPVSDRLLAASTATRRGQEQLAKFLLQVFEKKCGFPGYRGWFQCVELVSVYDPVRRRSAVLDEKRSR
jgi:hypothetical protein